MNMTLTQRERNQRTASPLLRYAPWMLYTAVAIAVLALAVVKVFFAAWTLSDSFTRTADEGWGALTGDHSYTIAGNPADFAVRDSVGLISIPLPDESYGAYLKNTTARDVDITFRFKTDKEAAGGSQIAYLVARRITFGTQYLGRVRLAPDGKVWLQAVREIGGEATLLGGERLVRDFTFKPNTFIWLRGQIVGANPTAIHLKAWADGTSEPAAWRYNVEDSHADLDVPGDVGVRAYLSGQATNAPVVFMFDDLHVSSLDFVVHTILDGAPSAEPDFQSSYLTHTK